MARTCLLTAYTLTPQWMAIGGITIPAMKEYAERHGLTLRIVNDGFDPGRAFQWGKILFIKKVLPEYEWVWWLDADALIANQTKTIDQFLSLDADVVMGGDVNATLCNTGSFFIRNCPFSFWLLDEIWKRDDLAKKPWHEQDALADLYRDGKCQGRVKLLPFREINGYCDWYAELYENRTPCEDVQWHVGDFIAHCAGYSMGHRYEILKEILTYYMKR